ncbi:DNA invertase Pin-like site-specific DNA recombinase [Paraburkholderia sp. Cpub6]|nr:DNA invertase Pin-like site-specific DNA recombinase [Paraburkholderia sp. Cpub6]
MQARGIAIAKTDGSYAKVGRKRKADYTEVKAWRAEHGASIAQTAAQFGISKAAVKRACAALATQ